MELQPAHIFRCEYDYFFDDNYSLDCNSFYNDLDQIKYKMDSIPPYCMNQYIVDAEISIMDDVLSQFNDLVNNSYDEKFGIFEEYTIEQVPYTSTTPQTLLVAMDWFVSGWIGGYMYVGGGVGCWLLSVGQRIAEKDRAQIAT